MERVGLRDAVGWRHYRTAVVNNRVRRLRPDSTSVLRCLERGHSRAAAYRQLSAGLSLDSVLCFKYLRTVANATSPPFNLALDSISYRTHDGIGLCPRSNSENDPGSS